MPLLFAPTIWLVSGCVLCFHASMITRLCGENRGLCGRICWLLLITVIAGGLKCNQCNHSPGVLSTPLLTSADESCPNTAPWSLLWRHSLACQLERREEAHSLHLCSKLTGSASAVLFSCCYSASHCAVQHTRMELIDFFRIRAYIILKNGLNF